MDGELLEKLREAWARVGSSLGPGELATRKARRRMEFFRRPPRAWCLAIRANDTRIGPGMVEIRGVEDNSPQRAQRILLKLVKDEWEDAGEEDADETSALPGWREAEHEVVLTAEGVRRLCRPVYLKSPTHWLEAAAQLGMCKRIISDAIRRGLLTVRRVKGLGGTRALPVPVVSCARPLDPAGLSLWRMRNTVQAAG